MSQVRKVQTSTFPEASGFIRAKPVEICQTSLRSKIIRAYQLQADLTPHRVSSTEDLNSMPSHVSQSDIEQLETINIEDLLASDRKAA